MTEDTPQGYAGANASDQTIPTLLDALCQAGKSSETVPQAHRQESMSTSSSSGREENTFTRFLMRVCASSGGDGVPHVDPHIDCDADDGDQLMQPQRTFFEPVSDPSIVVVSTRGGFSSLAKEDGERYSELI